MTPAMTPTGQRAGALRRVEFHMGTAITLAATSLSSTDADRFFTEIERLEACLSRFRPTSDLSLVASGAMQLDQADRSVREVLGRCQAMRELTDGRFEHEPRRICGDSSLPLLDPNALAKGWIIDQAAIGLRLAGAAEFFVNAGGDIITSKHPTSDPWRIGIQHPTDPTSIFATITLASGAVATSGTYQQGEHIHGPHRSTRLLSVTVVGPELATADALATAIYASAIHSPKWWTKTSGSYGLLTLDTNETVRWTPPQADDIHAKLSLPDATVRETNPQIA